MPGSVERYHTERAEDGVETARERSRSPLRKVKCSSNRITVSNIPFDMTWSALKELVKKEVGYTGFVVMVENNGKSAGMATVEFKTAEVAGLAIEKLHKFKVGDRALVVREESVRERDRMLQRDVGPNANELLEIMDFLAPYVLEKLGLEGPPTDSVYVSNLEFSVTWQKLKDLFRFAGHVVNVDVKEDPDGRSRGFGIVKFSHPFESVQAISMFNGQQFYGRTMRVKIDREGEPPRRFSRDRLPEIESQACELLPYVLAEVTNPGTRSAKSLALHLRLNAVPDGAADVGSGFGTAGLPLRGSHDIGMWIQDILRNRAPPSADRFYEPRRGLDREGPMNPKSVDPLMGMQALIAAAMRGGMREDQVLDVASAIGLPNLAPTGRLSGGSYREPDYGDRDLPPRSSLSSLSRYASGAMSTSPAKDDRPMRLSRGGDRSPRGPGKTSNPESKSVVVRNLPFSYDWQDLVRCFSSVANVRTAEIRLDENKRSKGFGFVHFFNAEDARKATEQMNGVRLDGRAVTVEQC